MRDLHKLITVFVLVSILIVPANAFALVYPPPLTINNPTPETADRFGNSVSLDGNNVLVGASEDDAGSSDIGSAYLYDDAGNLVLTFNNPTPIVFDFFGSSVSIDGNNVLVGASLDDAGATDAGSAYVFDITTCDDDLTNGGTAADGICEAALLTIINPTPTAFDQFGFSVSIDGNNVLVGAYSDDTVVSGTGAAYTFDITTCDADLTNGGTAGDKTCEAALLTINNPTQVSGDQFGRSVSISGNNVLVGAHFDNTGASDAGSAYTFDITTCDADLSNGGTAADGICEAAALTINNPTPESGDEFGISVSLDGNNVLVGAERDNTGATSAGSAYTFDITTCDADLSNGGTAADGICEAALLTINNPSPVSFDLFGRSVSISGNNVLVGAHEEDTGAADSGTAYLFDATNGNLLNTFNNPTPSTFGHFGESVSLDGNNVLVGAHFDDTGASDAGSAYLFIASVTSDQTEGQIDILGTCGITFDSGAPINYGSLEPGNTSSEETLVVKNTGTVGADLLVSGQDWVDATPTSIILVDKTAYSDATGNYASKTSLSTTPTEIIDVLVFLPSTPIDTYWQVLADLINPNFVGSGTQQMDFTASC